MSLGSMVRRAVSAFGRGSTTTRTPTRTHRTTATTTTGTPKAAAANKAVREVKKAAKKI